MKNNKITMKEYLVSTIIVTIISGIFIYFFSQSTSPIVEGYYSYDSAIFQVVGKSWIRGIVPYSQCFDHKGPFVFLMNAIGYAFGIGKTGVAIVQWLFCIVTFMFLYKISRLFTNEKKSMLVVLASYLILTITYGGGNFTEEYSLLFIVSSLFFGLKYLNGYDEKEKSTWKHPAKYAFVYGMSFMAILLMRVTSAIAICCLVFTILCILLWKKEIKNLVKNIVVFLGGAFLFLLPFAVYFYKQDSLYDMLFGTIIYNFLYASNATLSITKGLLLCFFIDLVLFIIGIMHVILSKETKDILGYFSIFLSVVSVIMLLKMNSYEHYHMITLPYFVIATGLAWEFPKNEKKRGKLFWKIAILMFVLQIAGGIYTVVQQEKIIASSKKYVKEYMDCCEEFQKYIPKGEKNVLTFGRNSLSAWYLVNDIDPSFQYCFVQDWQAKNSEIMTEEIMNYLNGEPAEWFVTNGDYDTKELYMPYNKKFKEIIMERYEYITSYTIYETFETYNLYKRKK